MNNTEPKLSDLQFCCRTVADNKAIEEAKIPYERLVRSKMARDLAESILTAKIVETKGEFTTRFDMDVLVMDYDTFYRFTRKIAAEMALDPQRYLFDLIQP